MLMRTAQMPFPSVAFGLLVAGATLALFLPALGNDFTNWDDQLYITENLHIRALNGAFFSWAFFRSQEVMWHPLTWVSHALDYAVWGLNPLGHHLTSILLHAVNTLLVFLLAARLVELRGEGDGRTGQTRLITATLTAALFGLHPLRVESVVWISERKDVLCALFVLLSILAYLAYQRPGSAQGTPGRGFRNWRYLASLGFFLLALLSKQMAITLPMVLLILDWYPLGRFDGNEDPREVFVEKLPFFGLSAAFAAITLMQFFRLAQAAAADPQVLTKLLVGSKALVWYASRIIWPVGLMPFYPYPQKVDVLRFEYGGAFLLAAMLFAGCIFAARTRWRVFSALGGYYFITLLPVLGIIKNANHAMADRYTYLPGLGPTLLLGLTGAWFWDRSGRLGQRTAVARRLIGAVAIVLLSLLAVATIRQISVWKDSVHLWNYMIDREPLQAAFPYINRGTALMDRGQHELALEDFTTAIAVDPAATLAYTNRGIIFTEMGYTDWAMADYTSAIAADPGSYRAYNNRGILFLNEGNAERAFEDFSGAISANPEYGEAYTNRGLVFELQGRLDLAREDFARAIALNPASFLPYYHRSRIYAPSGLTQNALDDLAESIRLNPGYAPAYYARGELYEQTGNAERARDDFFRSCELGSAAGCDAVQRYEP